MTIRLPDQIDVLVTGAKSGASRETVAAALRLESRMAESRSLEVADLILGNQKVSILCENHNRAEALCAALLNAGCKAALEK